MAKSQKSYMVRRGRRYLIERKDDGTFNCFIPIGAPKKSAHKKSSNKGSAKKAAPKKTAKVAKKATKATKKKRGRGRPPLKK